MSEKLKDILEEMRDFADGQEKNNYYDLREMGTDSLRAYADRIEAAVKHQFREVTKTIPHEEVGIRKMETIDEVLSRMHNTVVEYYQGGNKSKNVYELLMSFHSELLNSINSYQINSSKAREALEEIRAYVADMVCRSERNESLRKAIYNSARYALSAPARNCDMLADADEAKKAIHGQYPLHIRPQDERDAVIEWLYAEAKGEAK